MDFSDMPVSGVMPDEPIYIDMAFDRTCFSCGKKLILDCPESSSDPLTSNWHDATDWTSYGNWCSTKLDCAVSDTHPDNCKIAQIIICDECFEKYEDRILKIPYTEEEMAENKRRHQENMKKFQEFLRNEWKKDDSSESKT